MRRLVRALVAVLVTIVLTIVLGVFLIGSCGLPTPDGIRVDQRSVDTAADNPDIRKLPPGPAPGASPAEIVRGFLVAAAADPEQTTAQEFLASPSAWADSEAATVYDPQSVTAFKVTVKGLLSRVQLGARVWGQVATGGAFLPADRWLSVTYELRRLDGQWRLTDVPPGVLLTPRDLARGYRAVTTYGVSASRSLLVPEPGYVVSDRAGLAGAALHALLTGWGSDSGSPLAFLRGPAPGLTALGSVVVTNGEAAVDLGREAFNVPQQRRPLVVSQIAATLGTVPGVFTVRVLVEERPFVSGVVAAAIPEALAPASRGPALAVAPDGALVTLTQTDTRTTTSAVRWVVKRGGRAGATSLQGGRLADPVAAPDGAGLAALRLGAGRQQLVLAELHGSGQHGLGQLGSGQPTATEGNPIALKTAADEQYLAPQWVDSDRLLVASSNGRLARLQMVDAAAGTVHAVSAPGLAALGPLSAFAISRDGTRVIAVAGALGARRVYLGRIVQHSSGAERGVELTVTGWSPVPTSMADVAAVSWTGDLSVTVLGRLPGSLGLAASRPRAVVLALDTVTDPVPLPGLPPEFSAASMSAASSSAASPVAAQLAVTTAPDRSTLISVGSRTWTLYGGRWLAVAGATNISYP